MKLELNQVSYQYKKENKKILENFSLSMEDTERVGLIAPSGYGKTTLCKLIAGYLTPDSGEILLDGRRVSSYKGYCPIQMIWQQPELAVNPRLRMREVILEGDEVEPRILEALGIEKAWMDRFPTELSGGELQRFCLARALGKRTRFLLADEISTMLDLITQSQIWNFLLKEVKQRQIGVIAVSHNQALLEKVCSRQVRLDYAIK
ncbi:MAG: ATP-binding cassette domain-containing protein [Faecalicatena sp.]|uniref:ABC transporter ATP-binding protein n=1 Tax=Faecalicatena sp. TaxID=2005360 RepID=UPI00258FC5E4|nr:ATP-binding cassette domain-containing protein [Faecalicatena sp.]MCI6466275.1 ATP-binding cassette domain-containing protein [Faecalicatena sp.]MDY5617717.1 ATP-binding cassette domain-containing protein [Lachnospiraceae bacterium]